MRISRRLGARAVVLAALACTTCAWALACSSTLAEPVVHTAMTPDAPFGRYHTFSFDAPKGAPPGYTATARSDEAQQKMTPLIAAALAAKGYVQVPQGGDFVITHGAGRRDATTTRALSRRATALMGETEQETSFLEGSLVIDVYDGKTREEVWHGAATAEIAGAGINEQRLADAVRKVMETFPAATRAPAGSL